MKLLSRFIWLIIGISAIVFAGISIVQFRAQNKFEEIKTSISKEYDILVDKMLMAERTNVYTYNHEISNSPSTFVFLNEPKADPSLIYLDLDTTVLNFFRIDAIWFFKPDATPFYFNSHHNVYEALITLNPDQIENLFKNSVTTDFYIKSNKDFYRIFGSKIGDINTPQGFVFSASIQNQDWIHYYEKEINNSSVKFLGKDEPIAEVSKEVINIERPLSNFENATIGKIEISLNLPFLALWKDSNSTDNWLMIGSLVIILFFLIVFLIVWVVSPLKRISSSLQKGNSTDIQPLIDTKTEMGEVARMIGDYHRKTGELESSESIKRHIIEQAHVGIIIAEKSSNLIITTNPYACNLIRATDDAIIGNVSTNFLVPNKTDAQAIEMKGQESVLFNALGNEIPILRTSTSMYMDGKPVIMETFVDLSEIKNLQGKLEEEKKKLSLAVQNSGLIFCEYDFKTNEIVIDKNYEFLTKGDSSTIAENVIGNIYINDSKAITDKFDLINEGAKDTLAAEFRVKHPERGLIWLSASILITKRDENHKPKNLIGLLEDITERITVQQELIKAKEKAEESDRMKSSYLGNMSHKIRTPLNAIVGFANLISEEDLDQQEKDKFINVIRRDTEQVLYLIDDIINIAKIDANQLDVYTKECSINQMIGNLVEYYKTHEKAEKIKLSVKTMLPDGKDILVTDADKLQQSLNNLINNAFKFTKEGNVELGYYINPVDQKIIIYVKDSGIGIPDSSKDKIFTHYYQVNPMSEGTGLGLTISKSMISLIGGKLYFDSKVDQGSTFYVELPFKES